MTPEDLLTFIQFPHFRREWNRLRLDDEDLRALEIAIMCNPRQPVVAGTGGLRKLRFAPPGWRRGKSGALRIGYVFLEEFSVVGLIVVYAKADAANISPAGRQVIRRAIEQFTLYWRKGG
ncbi:MAG: hypothetical protein ACHRHE_14100 [Tepidisphaerales bacterium]